MFVGLPAGTWNEDNICIDTHASSWNRTNVRKMLFHQWHRKYQKHLTTTTPKISETSYTKYFSWVFRSFQEYLTFIQPIVHERLVKTAVPPKKTTRPTVSRTTELDMHSNSFWHNSSCKVKASLRSFSRVWAESLTLYHLPMFYDLLGKRIYLQLVRTCSWQKTRRKKICLYHSPEFI